MKKTVLLVLLVLPLLALSQSKQLGKKVGKQRIATLQKVARQYKHFYCSDTTLIVYFNEKESGLMDMEGNVLLKGNYFFSPQDNSPLIMVQRDSLAGFVDHQGRGVLPLEFDAPGECACHMGRLFDGSGTYTLQKNGKYGVIDSAGNIIEPFVHDEYFILDENRKWKVFSNWLKKETYFLSRDGKKKIGPYEYIFPFSHAITVFQMDEKYGCLDTNGNVILPCQYERVHVIDDHCVALKDNEQWMLREYSNGYVQYRDTPLQQEGLDFPYWMVQEGELILCAQTNPDSKETMLGAINRKGETVIPFQYNLNELRYGKYIVLFGQENSDIYDHSGRLLKRFEYLTVFEDEDILWYDLPAFAAQKDSLWGLVDSDFNTILPFQYKELRVQDSSRAFTRLANGNNAIIDYKGNIIIEGPFNSITPVCNGIYECSTFIPDNHDWIVGYIDLWGHTTLSRKELKKARQCFKEKRR